MGIFSSLHNDHRADYVDLMAVEELEQQDDMHEREERINDFADE